MNADDHDLDARIEELTGLSVVSASGADSCAPRLELGALLTKRYLEGGTDDDRRRARSLCEEALADPKTSAPEREKFSLLLATLIFMTATPAMQMRQGALDREAFRRSEEWRESVDEPAMLAELARGAQLLASVSDLDSIPPEAAAMVRMMRVVPRMLAGGDVDHDAVDEFRTLLPDLPEVPGQNLKEPTSLWLDKFDRRRPHTPEADSTRAEALTKILETVPADHLFGPDFRQELAALLVDRTETTGDRDALRRSVVLLKAAEEGMAPDDPQYGETVRMLVGAMTVATALEYSPAEMAEVELLADELLRRPEPDSPAGRGSDLFLRGLTAGLRSHYENRPALAQQALRDLVGCLEILPENHRLYEIATTLLSGQLSDRKLKTGHLRDADAAHYLIQSLRDGVPEADPADSTQAFLACAAAVTRLNSLGMDDAVGREIAADELAEAMAGLPPQHVLRGTLELTLRLARMQSNLRRGDPNSLRSTLDALRNLSPEIQVAGAPPELAGTMAGVGAVLNRMMTGETAGLTDEIDRLEQAFDQSTRMDALRPVLQGMFGQLYQMAADTGAAPDAAARSMDRYEQAVAELSTYPTHPMLVEAMRGLARARRAAGRCEESRHLAREALARQTGTVLLQSGTADSVKAGRGAALEAGELANWCLLDGDLPGAFTALEVGRGLALHAATSSRQVPTLLRELGRPDLAQRWEEDALAHRTDPMPWTLDLTDDSVTSRTSTTARGASLAALGRRVASDLRQEVLSVLQREPSASQLFHAPDPTKVAEALRVVGATALVYLVPAGPDHDSTGQMLLLHADGQLTVGPEAAGGHDDPISRHLGLDAECEAEEWTASLEEVCGWAGRKVLKPLMDHLGIPVQDRSASSDGVPRVVLVPGGVLGAVPWAAAALQVGSGNEVTRLRACQSLGISTAASARQLIDVAGRPRLPLTMSPTLICAPQDDLFGAIEEVLTLRDTFYPGCAVLGDLSIVQETAPADVDPETDRQLGGVASPAAVLDRLPGYTSMGASLLHFSCHGIALDGPGKSFLSLSTRLPVSTILEHATGRTSDSPGPLVVLSACESDLTADDYDEGLTLSTAFLSAGAVSVVGSRWSVPDRMTGILMFAFHHFLGPGGQPPAEALRRAQAWMAGGKPTPLPAMPEAMIGDVESLDLTDVAGWGAFGHHGR
jgi:hypothetical protein